MLAIIDINSGNLGSLESALKRIDVKYKICKNIQDIGDTKKIILFLSKSNFDKSN